MHHTVSAVHAERHRTSAQIALIIDVALQLPISAHEHSEAADIKLAVFVKGRRIDVFLNDESSLGVVAALSDNLLDFS